MPQTATVPNQQRPAYGSIAIDLDNPLASNLRLAIPFAEGGGVPHDLLGHVVTTVATPTWDNGLRQALVFNGSTQAASVAVDLSNTSAVTLAWWGYWAAYGTTDNLFFEYTANYNSNNGFICDPNSGSDTTGIDIAQTNGAAGTTGNWFPRTGASAATWHHFVAVYDLKVGVQFYVDGVKQTSGGTIGGAIGGTAFANSTLYLMSRATTSLFGNGKMDDLFLWGRVATEATRLYRDPNLLYRTRPQRRYFVSAATVSKAASDAAILAEAVANALVASDAAALTEAVTIAVTAAATESTTFAETAALALATNDTATLAELINIAIPFSAADVGALAETAALTVSLSTAQAATLAEQVSIAANVSALDAAALSDAAALAVTTSAADAAVLSQVLANALSTLDMAGLTEVGANLSAALAANDTGAITSAVALALNAAEAAGLTETAVTPGTQIGVVGSTSTIGANGSCSMSTPVGIADGNLLLVEIIQSGSTAITAPSGWTSAVGPLDVDNASAVVSGAMQVFRKVWRTGDPTSYAFTSASTYIDGYLYALNNEDQTTLIDVTATTGPTTTAGTSGTIPSLVTTAPNDALMVFIATWGSNTTAITYPAGWTKEIETDGNSQAFQASVPSGTYASSTFTCNETHNFTVALVSIKLGVGVQVSATDQGTLGEQASIASVTAVAAAEAAAVAEQASISTNLAAAEAGTVGQSAVAGRATSAADLATLLDQATIAIRPASVDVGALSESIRIAVNLSATETAALAEAFGFIVSDTQNVSLVDRAALALAFGEQAALVDIIAVVRSIGAVAAAEQATVTEAVALTIVAAPPPPPRPFVTPGSVEALFDSGQFDVGLFEQLDQPSADLSVGTAFASFAPPEIEVSTTPNSASFDSGTFDYGLFEQSLTPDAPTQTGSSTSVPPPPVGMANESMGDRSSTFDGRQMEGGPFEEITPTGPEPPLSPGTAGPT